MIAADGAIRWFTDTGNYFHIKTGHPGPKKHTYLA